MPGDDADVAPQRRVRLCDLADSGSEGPEPAPTLRGRDGQRYLPVHLGAAFEAYMPPLLRFLCTFGPGDMAAELKTRSRREEGELVVSDRTVLGNLVLHRKTWSVPVALAGRRAAERGRCRGIRVAGTGCGSPGDPGLGLPRRAHRDCAGRDGLEAPVPRLHVPALSPAGQVRRGGRRRAPDAPRDAARAGDVPARRRGPAMGPGGPGGLHRCPRSRSAPPDTAPARPGTAPAHGRGVRSRLKPRRDPKRSVPKPFRGSPCTGAGRLPATPRHPRAASPPPGPRAHTTRIRHGTVPRGPESAP